MTIAKYRAQAQRVEEELRQLRAGQQELGGQAVVTEGAAAAGPGPTTAAHSNNSRKEGQEHSTALPLQQQAACQEGMWL